MNRHPLTRPAAAVALLTATMAAATAAPAAANDDTRRVTGDCSGSSEFTYRLSDSGGELRNQSLRFFIDGDRGDGREWTIRVFVDDERVHTAAKQTNTRGNANFSITLFADDDAEVRIYAEAGYGETCRRTLSLD